LIQPIVHGIAMAGEWNVPADALDVSQLIVVGIVFVEDLHASELVGSDNGLDEHT